MKWTWIKVGLIWANVILILVQFLVFAIPLILILIYEKTFGGTELEDGVK